ncbi:hypothetical protein Y1Q_0003637 [Alligator mississippiensis]|uniref:Uncharacterized protein n=1 Tax=Alligator mississippiensis TaxID=8496 RepID=A0A151MSF8_ALLMI|nr:hypothetical protein Y1Q_0003637 [Alligator mississippiensis]
MTALSAPAARQDKQMQWWSSFDILNRFSSCLESRTTAISQGECCLPDHPPKLRSVPGDIENTMGIGD